MDRVGLRVGPFELVHRVYVPEPGVWYLGRSAGHEPVFVRFGDDDDLDAVRHQREVLARIDDPRVPAPLDLDDDALVVRAFTGASLGDALAMRGDETVVMTPATLLDLVLEVGRALTRAHDAGVVHGHLDP
ncbi:MAG: hypothetical protein ABMB14_25210, partial [Myxococcota bacterium]